MRKKSALALLTAFCLLSFPVNAQEYLLDSLTITRSEGAGDAAPRVLASGLYGERYAALPGRQYLILPPKDSALAQPQVEKTSAGTYRYRYSPADEALSGNDRVIAALIASFEAPDGTQTVPVQTREGETAVVGAYDRDEAKRMFILLNEQRKEADLPALSWDASLADAARLRAAELAVSHSPMRPDGTQYDAAEEKIRGENFLYGYETADIAVARMMELPAKKENMLSKKFVTVGTAAFESNGCAYWVMEFGREAEKADGSN